jgi:hypothetical protein
MDEIWTAFELVAVIGIATDDGQIGINHTACASGVVCVHLRISAATDRLRSRKIHTIAKIHMVNGKATICATHHIARSQDK